MKGIIIFLTMFFFTPFDTKAQTLKVSCEFLRVNESYKTFPKDEFISVITEFENSENPNEILYLSKSSFRVQETSFRIVMESDSSFLIRDKQKHLIRDASYLQKLDEMDGNYVQVCDCDNDFDLSILLIKKNNRVTFSFESVCSDLSTKPEKFREFFKKLYEINIYSQG